MQSLFLRRLFYFTICSLVSNACSFAQYDEKNFVRYTVKDGLSDNNVTALQQDEWGYLWIGTDIGLNRFDGYQFKNYYQGSPENFKTSSIISNLRSLKDHRLAIVTRNGFQILNTANGTIQNYFIRDSTAFVTMRNIVYDVKELADGSFGVSTASGFYVMKNNGDLAFRHDAYALNDIGNKRIFYGRNIFTLPDNELLIYVEEQKQAHYRMDQKIFHEVAPTEKEWKVFSHPSEEEGGHWVSKTQIGDHEYIFLSRQDSLIYYNHALRKRVASALPFHWIDEFTWESEVVMLNDSTFIMNGGYSGFYLFHLQHHTGFITGSTEKFLGDYQINSLFQDRDDRLWVGTSAGLLRQTIVPPVIQRYHWPVEEESNFGYVDAYLHKGRLYLGRFARNTGLLILDATSLEILNEITFYDKGSAWNEVFSMEMYHADTLWIGTRLGLLWFDTKTDQYGKVLDPYQSPPEAYKLNILVSPHPDGSAWLLDWLGGKVARYHILSRSFTMFDVHSYPPLPFQKVKSVAYDAYGDIWIGGHSLTRWNNRTQEFDTLISVYGGPNKFNDDIIAMSADADGSLWLHNAENGLLQYKIKERQFVAFSMKDGLQSVVITCLSPVYNHTLFIGSPHHLTRFDTRTHEVEIYGDEDDLPELLSSSRNMFLDTLGQQGYAFYKNEVIRFSLHPAAPRYSSSELLIEEVVINNHKTFFYPNEVMQLKEGENNLTLHYSVIDFEGGNNYQFAYHMNDADSWTSLGQQRTLNLTSLPPGSYTLGLRATGNAGEQKTKTLLFSIAPPFWKTGWFTLLSILLGAGMTYVIYRFRITQIRQKANLDKLLSQSEMNALRAQMNPHFVFNSLNSIREMILNNENTEASRYLGKFAHLIRVTLDQSHESFISLRHTMDYLNRYIEMEKIRNAHFRFEMRADPMLDLDETILPPMLIQPFIENAIWHGANGNGKGIDIHVEFKKQQEQLVCTIDDNGIGIRRALDIKRTADDNGHRSVGISNIQDRIDLLNKKYHQQSSVTIQDKETLPSHPETGTLITIILPLDISSE